MTDESLIEALHDDVYRLLTRLGIDDLAALREAGSLCEELQRRFGGRDHYMPAIDKLTRNARIAAELAAGVKPADIAQKYDITPRMVRKISSRTQSSASLGFGKDDWVL